MVSICAKDRSGPFDYDVTNGLIAAAKKMGANYAVDVYPFYSSDVATTLRSGHDVKHGLIGAGVYAKPAAMSAICRWRRIDAEGSGGIYRIRHLQTGAKRRRSLRTILTGLGGSPA